MYMFCINYICKLVMILWRTVGIQNQPPQNVPHWHVSYFELKTLQAHKKLQPLFNLN